MPSVPLFGGEQGFTLASLHTICLCPLAFPSVSRCYQALFTSQHQHRPVVYPAPRHSIVLHHLSMPTTCLWIYQYVRSGKAYQRSISEVPSSGYLTYSPKHECWETHTVQALQTDYDGQDPLLRCQQDKLQESPYDTITILLPRSRQAQRSSGCPVWLREYSFLELRMSCSQERLGCSTMITSMRPWTSVSKVYERGGRQMTGCAGYTLGRGANYFIMLGRRKGWYIWPRAGLGGHVGFTPWSIRKTEFLSYSSWSKYNMIQQQQQWASTERQRF